MNSLFNMARVKALTKCQAKEFYRDFGSVFFSFVFPLFFVIALVVTNLMEPTFRFEFGMVDTAQRGEGRKLAEALSATQNVGVRSVDREQGLALLKEGKLHVLLVLPAAPLVGDKDNTPGTIEIMAAPRYQGFAKVVFDSARAKLLLGDQPRGQGYEYKTSSPPGKADSDFNFIYPGMLAMGLLQLGLFATATPLLRARERGTLTYLLLTPMGVSELLTAQISVRFVVSLFQMAVLLAAGMFVVQMPPGEWLKVLAISCSGAIMLIALGYAIAGLAPNQEVGMAAIMILNFAMMFGGNVFWDPAGNQVLTVVATLMPVSFLADLYRQVISHSAGMWSWWLDVLVMLGWTTVAIAVARKTFRFDMVAR